MSITLIQLISDQTVPNLLPILRFKPSKLIHITTRRTASRSAILAAAIQQAMGATPDVRTHMLSDMPNIAETFDAVRQHLASLAPDERAIINFTGGTKLMSIGAFAAAQIQRCPSVYVDTQDACFVDGNTGPELAQLLQDNWSFTPLMDQLTLDVMGIANGNRKLSPGLDWQAMLPLAHHFYDTNADEEQVFDAVHGRHGFLPGGREPAKPAGWLPLLDRPLHLPEKVATLAVEAGLFRPGGHAGDVLLPDTTRAELEALFHAQDQVIPGSLDRAFNASAPLQHALSFLVGGWWEVIVCDALNQSGQVRDLRWSCEVYGAGQSKLEEDVLALDGVELLYVSCKRGGHKSKFLPLLEEIRSRASTVGGSFSRPILAVLHPPAPHSKAWKQLEAQAKRHKIRLITGQNVYAVGAFAR